MVLLRLTDEKTQVNDDLREKDTSILSEECVVRGII